jgi:hypothetical protein
VIVCDDLPPGDPVQIREYRPGDEDGILACYNEVFPAADPRIKPRSMAHWRWKFLDNPQRRIQITVADHREDGIVGTYAGIPVAVWAEGRVQHAAQAVDLVVAPKYRNHGGRPGLFARTGKLWIERYIGDVPDKNLFTYGWPVPAWRAGQKYLDYLNIRDWDVLFREVSPSLAKRGVAAALSVAEVQRFGSDVDALFVSLRQELRLALVRDSAYLNWRYTAHPDVRYRLYECRERASGALRGICVYALTDFLAPRAAYIVDWLLPATDQDATVAMVSAAEEQAVADGARALGCIFNHVDPRFLGFQRLGYMVLGTSYFIVLVTARPDTVYYRENWFFTMGDSDLV